MARRGGRRGSRGRSSSRRSRGRTGGQGSGGSGKGKGKGGSRGRSSGTRGGQGNKGRSSSKSKSASSKAKSSRRRGNIRSSSIKSKLAKAGITKKTPTATTKKTISASASRKAARDKAKKARENRKNLSIGSITRGALKKLKGLRLGRPAKAGDLAGKGTTQRSKLRRQLSNLKNDAAQKSTRDARFKRRADRLRKQYGLDYSRMNPSFKIDASIDQAAQKLGIRDNPLYQKYVPKDVKNWKFKYTMQAPTKLGVREGYKKPDSNKVASKPLSTSQLAMRRNEARKEIKALEKGKTLPRSLAGDTLTPEQGAELLRKMKTGSTPRSLAGDELTPKQGEELLKRMSTGLIPHKGFTGTPMQNLDPRGRTLKPSGFDPRIHRRDGGYLDFYTPENQKKINTEPFMPEQGPPKPSDWLGDFYSTYNIGRKGGYLDQEARDYWGGQADIHGIDRVKKTIEATAKKDKTWGGMSEPTFKLPKPINTHGRPPRRPPGRRGGSFGLMGGVSAAALAHGIR
tara:strand:- start:920 stop:2458 length:1539 start_codon:yes stop_codon:yes gene_type:complete